LEELPDEWVKNSSGTLSWDMSELSIYLERRKCEFKESREVADAQRVELMTEGRIVKSKKLFFCFVYQCYKCWFFYNYFFCDLFFRD